MSSNDIYDAPKPIGGEESKNQLASKPLKICALILTILSIAELAPVGISHDMGNFYAVGYALSGVIFAGFFVGVFQLFKALRSQGARFAIYTVMLPIYMVIYFPQLLAVINA